MLRDDQLSIGGALPGREGLDRRSRSVVSSRLRAAPDLKYRILRTDIASNAIGQRSFFRLSPATADRLCSGLFALAPAFQPRGSPDRPRAAARLFMPRSIEPARDRNAGCSTTIVIDAGAVAPRREQARAAAVATVVRFGRFVQSRELVNGRTRSTR
jgi:hypothetical protein